MTNNYRSLKYELNPGQFEVFPPFATFLELPSIKLLWVPAPRSGAHWFYTKYRYPSAPISHIHEKWRTALPSIKSEIVMAIRWYKIGYARIMADSLQASSRPLPASLLSALNPPGTSTPASWETLELGTIDYDDPSRIPTKSLDELLNRYSTQAWYGGKGQMPGHFSHHLPSEQINQFPRFHPYWHNVLLQALEVADFSDGPVGETAVRLDSLGEKFFCGQCSTLENGVRLSTLVRFLSTSTASGELNELIRDLSCLLASSLANSPDSELEQTSETTHHLQESQHSCYLEPSSCLFDEPTHHKESEMNESNRNSTVGASSLFHSDRETETDSSLSQSSFSSLYTVLCRLNPHLPQLSFPRLSLSQDLSE